MMFYREENPHSLWLNSVSHVSQQHVLDSRRHWVGLPSRCMHVRRNRAEKLDGFVVMRVLNSQSVLAIVASHPPELAIPKPHIEWQDSLFTFLPSNYFRIGRRMAILFPPVGDVSFPVAREIVE